MSSLASIYKTSNKRTIYAVLISIVVLSLCIGCLAIYYNDRIDDLRADVNYQKQQLSTKYLSKKSVEILIYSPLKNTQISSPLSITGQVPGNWSFEGSFPIQLKNSSGKIVASGTGILIGDWMTNDLVTFTSELSWTSIETGNGKLLIKNDNSSGLTKNDDLISIPVRFD